MNSTFALIVLIFVALIVIVVWVKIQSFQCVTYGKFHIFDGNFYQCETCGRPFCSANAYFQESASSKVQGQLISISTSGVSSKGSMHNSCGAVFHYLSNTKPEIYIYRCKEHAN